MVEPSSAVPECMEQLAAGKLLSRPLSTYRLQFNKDFHFEDARHLVGYLHKLGISHCYASPILKARAGSTHGYDNVDHNRMNPEIGTEEEFRALVGELKAYGMGLILDSVPNHMGVGEGSNPWWQDVLQNGRTSAHVDYFDIDWEPLKPELRGKVLIPILSNPYGEDLEQGNIKVEFRDGQFYVTYFDNVLPIDPQTIPLLFEPLGGLAIQKDCASPARADLTRLLGELNLLPGNNVTNAGLISRRQREAPVLLARFQKLVTESPEVRALINEALANINGRPGDDNSFDSLHCLLEAQVYRLAFWRVSGEEINYRRFFDINDLVGIRMEDPRVFADTHRLIRQLLGEGLISGIRIDHPDGLLNPVQYFSRLQMLFMPPASVAGLSHSRHWRQTGIELEVQSALAQDSKATQATPLYLLVEKILEPGEELPSSWPVDGTVGYDFANLVNGILIDRRNERHFTKLYHRVLGRSVDVESVIYDSKKLIMYDALSSEVNVLSHMLNEISSHDRSARDFTRSVLRDAIREAIACFPVYRTYIDEHGNVQERDRRYIQQAIDRAKRRNPAVFASAVFDFLRSILLLEGTERTRWSTTTASDLYFTLKFQQLTGPVMAKGLEDTACYVYNRFVSVNEVGGSPADFGVPLDEFHRGNQIRARKWPNSMLATSTHDTKRSEDVRARLDVLSEMPRRLVGERDEVVPHQPHPQIRMLSDGRVVPDNNEEYLLLSDSRGRMADEYGKRGGAAGIRQRAFSNTWRRRCTKPRSTSAGSTRTLNTWRRCRNSSPRTLSPTYRGKPNLFWDSLQKFMAPVIYFGALNSLTQTLLKLTSPGVPDIYQGQEMYDFSLVDPDNRRPVNFDLRASAAGAPGSPGEFRRPDRVMRGVARDLPRRTHQAVAYLAGARISRLSSAIVSIRKLRAASGPATTRANMWWRLPVPMARKPRSSRLRAWPTP